MAFSENMRPVNKVRTCITELMNACMAVEDAAAVVSVHIPGEPGSTGFTGGSPESFPIAIAGALERIYNALRTKTDKDTALDILAAGIEDITGVRMVRPR